MGEDTKCEWDQAADRDVMKGATRGVRRWRLSGATRCAQVPDWRLKGTSIGMRDWRLKGTTSIARGATLGYQSAPRSAL